MHLLCVTGEFSHVTRSCDFHEITTIGHVTVTRRDAMARHKMLQLAKCM